MAAKSEASRLFGGVKLFRMLIAMRVPRFSEMTKWADCCVKDRIMVYVKESLFVLARPCVSAEIPPAGAPSGFDSAAMIDFIICFFCGSAAPLRMT